MPQAPKKKRTRDIKATILDTALQLFSSRGYFNTSVHDIRKAADVSTGSIYHHFASKEAIAKDLYDDLLAKMTEKLELICEQHQSAHDRCRQAVALLFEMTEADPVAMEFMLHAKHREFMPEEQTICSSRPFTLMRQMVRDGIDRGEIRDMDDTVAASCLFGGPLRLIVLRLDCVLHTPITDLLQETWECSWRAVACK